MEKELDIIGPDFATMFCIAHLPTVTARDVTRLTGIPKNSISRAVAKLAQRRLLRPDLQSAKGRQIVLTLTPAGHKLYATILGHFQARESRMLLVLSAPEQRTLDKLLAKMVLRDDGWSEVE